MLLAARYSSTWVDSVLPPGYTGRLQGTESTSPTGPQLVPVLGSRVVSNTAFALAAFN